MSTTTTPTIDFDPSIYTTSPQFSLSGGITLVRSLVQLTPKSASAAIKKSSRRLGEVADAAQQAVVDRQRELGVVSDETAAIVDHEADQGWIALRDRLAAYAMLPVERFPKAARAGELVVNLFGASGTDFLNIRYDEQLTAMSAKLARIKDDKLAAEINDLAGPEFLAQVQHVNPRYAAMVHGRLQKDNGTGQNLSNHVRALQKAVVDYGIKVVATADTDVPATVAAVQVTLRPMAALREQNARRASRAGASGTTTGEANGEAQAPEAPATTAAASTTTDSEAATPKKKH